MQTNIIITNIIIRCMLCYSRRVTAELFVKVGDFGLAKDVYMLQITTVPRARVRDFLSSGWPQSVSMTE